MKKTLLMLVLVFAVIGMLSFAMAQQPEDNDTDGKANKSANETAKNMTYGQCVMAAAKVKNTCYADVKNASEACKADAENATDSKNASKDCINTYKQDKKQCKADFKSTKRTECGKIKHNIFQTIGYAFY